MKGEAFSILNQKEVKANVLIRFLQRKMEKVGWEWKPCFGESEKFNVFGVRPPKQLENKTLSNWMKF